MKFKIDENLPVDLAHQLRAEGHDASTVYDEGLQGADDEPLMEICLREGRSVITLDLGFGDIRTYPPDQHPGVVLLRLARQDKPYVLRCFRQVFALLSHEPLAGHLWIVEDARIRILGGKE